MGEDGEERALVRLRLRVEAERVVVTLQVRQPGLVRCVHSPHAVGTPRRSPFWRL
jgi:hypothetical protein